MFLKTPYQTGLRLSEYLSYRPTDEERQEWSREVVDTFEELLEEHLKLHVNRKSVEQMKKENASRWDRKGSSI